MCVESRSSGRGRGAARGRSGGRGCATACGVRESVRRRCDRRHRRAERLRRGRGGGRVVNHGRRSSPRRHNAQPARSTTTQRRRRSGRQPHSRSAIFLLLLLPQQCVEGATERGWIIADTIQRRYSSSAISPARCCGFVHTELVALARGVRIRLEERCITVRHSAQCCRTERATSSGGPAARPVERQSARGSRVASLSAIVVAVAWRSPPRYPLRPNVAFFRSAADCSAAHLLRLLRSLRVLVGLGDSQHLSIR